MMRTLLAVSIRLGIDMVLDVDSMVMPAVRAGVSVLDFSMVTTRRRQMVEAILILDEMLRRLVDLV